MWYKDSSFDSSDVVVDLSNLMEPITAYEDISDMLSEEQERKLVDYVRAASQMSWYSVSKRYDHWRDADRAHDVWVPADTTKFREKAVIADTRAIADTVLTYQMAALSGKPDVPARGTNRKFRSPHSSWNGCYISTCVERRAKLHTDAGG